MKLLVVNWQDGRNPQAGGAETHLHEVFGRLAARGHHVTLLASGWRGAAPREEVDGLDVHRVGGRHTFNVAAPWYYRAALRDQGFDLVVEDLNKVPLFTPWWGRFPLVLLVHHLFGRTAFDEASFPIALATWLFERPLARVYREVPVEAVSPSTAEDLERRGFRRDRIVVIPNGVALDALGPADEPRFERPTLLYLGRLKRYKRIDLIIRSVALLRERGCGARLIIAGRGDHEPALRRLVAELGVEDAVELVGFVSEEEKRRLFRKAWVHVLTSSKEGWGITNLEAAACGTPTVASDSPGLRDSVVDGETGFLVPHGDVAALADALERVLSSAELRDRLGRGARRFAERFDWERAAQRTEEHLQWVLEQWTGPGGDRRERMQRRSGS
ncbi:MAG TPA: glycosyltransferase family 4 protein [Longimicrobiales bacterium]